MHFTQSLIIFDVETTDPKIGLGGVWPEIIEIGAVRVSPEGLVVDQFQRFVRPLNLEGVTDDVLRITGISLESVTSAKPWKEQWRDFAEFTSFNDITLAAWGADYDIPCLKLAYSRAYIGYPHNVRAFDLMTFVRTYGMMTGRRFTKFSVQSIAQYFGINVLISYFLT